MTHPNERPAPLVARGTGLTGSFGWETEHLQDTATRRKGDRPTDLERVLTALRDRWVCAIEFNRGTFDGPGGKPILRYTARFWDLKQAGWWIDRQKCERHEHDAPIYEWRIPPAEPEQTDLFGGGL